MAREARRAKTLALPRLAAACPKSMCRFGHPRGHIITFTSEYVRTGKTAMAIWWIECVMGVRLRGKSLYEALSSGELLCDLINTVQPGLVPRITRASECTEMSAMRIAAKQRDNITRYLEACAGLGMRQYDLFMVVDLFEQKNLDAVSKNILSLSQLAAEEFSEWHGPVLSVRTNRVWFQPGALVSDWTNPADPSWLRLRVCLRAGFGASWP